MGGEQSQNRRRDKRVALDIPVFITLSVSGGDKYKVMLNNVSTSGVQVDLPPGIGPSVLKDGSSVLLYGFPQALSFLTKIKGKTIWLSDACCGIEFNKPLDMAEEELIDIVQQF